MLPDGKLSVNAAGPASPAGNAEYVQPRPGQRSVSAPTNHARPHRRYRILVLGASYGSLFATKLLLAGHTVKLVGLPAAVDLIRREGTRVRMPVRGRSEAVEVDSRHLPGYLSASTPTAIGPIAFDLVVLAMQEPQYRSAAVRTLLQSVARARVPCLSIMNMPPLPFLQRIPGIDIGDCRPCYTDPAVWEAFDPALVTHCSADPQASHVPGGPENLIQVRLASNFKAARFESESHNDLLRALAADVDAARFETDSGLVELPVKLKMHDSMFVPLAKWPMLVAGNYRCITPAGTRAIEAAVHSDLGATRRVYEWVLDLCRSLGAQERDLVAFDRYAEAAHALKAPSSVARALSSGAPYVERVDRLVQAIAAQRGLTLEALDEVVALVDARLAANRDAGG